MSDGPAPGEFEPPPRLKGMAAGDGTNPFRDEASLLSGNEGAPSTSNVYDGPGGPFAAAPDLKNYEMSLPHRGTAVLMFGIFGLLGATLGSLGLFCCLPFPMFALALSVPAWLMGRMDLKAMDAGAMDNKGRDSTFYGYIMGVIGTIIAVLICAGFGGWIAWGILRHG